MPHAPLQRSRANSINSKAGSGSGLGMPHAPLQRSRANSTTTKTGSSSGLSMPGKVGGQGFTVYSQADLKKRLAKIESQLTTAVGESRTRLTAAKNTINQDIAEQKSDADTILTNGKQRVEEARKKEEKDIKLDQFASIAVADINKNNAIAQAEVEALEKAAVITKRQADEAGQVEIARAEATTAIEIEWLQKSAEISRKVVSQMDEQDAERQEASLKSTYDQKKVTCDSEAQTKKSRIATDATTELNALPAETTTKKTAAEQLAVTEKIRLTTEHEQLQATKAKGSKIKRGILSFFTGATSVSSASAPNFSGGAGIRDLKTREWTHLSSPSATSTQMGTAGGGIGIGAAGLGFIDDSLTIGTNFSDRNHADEARRRDARGDMKSAALSIGIRGVDVSAQSVGLAVTIGTATAASAVAAPIVAVVAGTAGTVRSGARGVKAQKYKNAITEIDRNGVSSDMGALLDYAGGQMKVRRNKMGVEVLAGTVGVAGAIALSVAAIAGTALLMATPVGWGLAVGAAAIGLGYLLYRVGRNIYKRFKGGVGSERELNATKIVQAYLGKNGADDKRAATDLLKALKIVPTTAITTKEQVVHLTNLLAKKLKSS